MLLKLFFSAFLVSGSYALASATFSSDIDASLLRAKTEKRPLLISFYGIWCPPCNELEEVVFESAAFIRSSKDFILLKVDADAPESWALKDRYRVGGYPTVIFTTPQGKEIYRIIGLREVRDFVRTMNWVFDNRELDLERACKGRSTAAIWHCAFTCNEQADEGCAEGAFKKLEKHLKPADFRYHALRTYQTRKLKADKEKAGGFLSLLKMFPRSPFIYQWASDLVELPKGVVGQDEFKAALLPVVKEYESVMKHPKLDMVGLVPSDVAQIRADLLDKIGDVTGARAAWRDADKLLADLAKQLPQGSGARGYTLERISCLSSAGEKVGALVLSNEYRKKYPKEFTFHFRSAGLLKDLGKPDDALQAARDAYGVSYGDNRIRSATLLIELTESKDKEKAKVVYDEVKSQIHPDAKLDVRTHRYLKKLDEAFKRLG